MTSSLSLSPSVDGPLISVTMVLGRGGRYFKASLRHRIMLLQHLVLMSVIQLFTFCLLTLLSLVPEITFGLRPC